MKHKNNLLKIDRFFEQYHLIPQNSTIVIGFSGGPDSMFLLHLLAHIRKEKNLALITAHLDHEWRPESAREVEFCREASKQLSIKFVSACASNLSSPVKFDGSKEELGRKLRRQFLESVADDVGADRIALGHHAQDQQETFLIRLIRGSSLSGLTCMRPKSGKYIRPLLETDKKDIIQYLNQQKIEYLRDPSNLEPTFLRNKIRLHVLPELRTCDDRFDANFARTLTKLQAADNFISEITAETFTTISTRDNGKTKVNLKLLFKLNSYLQRRIILHWLISESVPFVPQESFIDEIFKFLKGEHGGSHHLHETWKIEKKENWAWIKKNKLLPRYK